MSTVEELLQKSASFHNHLCPRQVLGVRIGLAGGRCLGLDVPQTDKRILTLVETDGCFIDGLAAATGCNIGRRSMYVPNFVAFYADCYHEVKPITSGYRVCLIYNLAIADRKKQPRLSQQTKIIEDVGSVIQKWSQENRENPILAYLLEHSYSEQNIRLSNLKQGDFAKASVLLNAAEQDGCQAFLCLVTYYRTSLWRDDLCCLGRIFSKALTLPRKSGVRERRKPELFERVTDKEKRTAARTTWEKKHADYITFAFSFGLA